MFRNHTCSTVLLVAGLAAACSKDGSHSEQVVREKRIALLDRGDLDGRFMPGGSPIKKLNRELALTPRSCLVIPPGMTARYPAVPVHHQAKFVYWLAAIRAGVSTLELLVGGELQVNRSIDARARPWIAC